MDRTTKILVFAVALALWLQVIQDWTRPTPVLAQGGVMDGVIAQNEAFKDISAIRANTDSMAQSLRDIAGRGAPK